MLQETDFDRAHHKYVRLFVFNLPCKGINLFGKLAEEDVLGSVGEHQHDVHVSRPQLHQVAHVGDIRQLSHLHKILLGRPTENNSKNKKLKNTMILEKKVLKWKL